MLAEEERGATSIVDVAPMAYIGHGDEFEFPININKNPIIPYAKFKFISTDQFCDIMTGIYLEPL